MAAQIGTHPSADALRGFAAGKLDETTAAGIMSHLDDCPDCCRAVAALSSDNFLDRLRRAHSLCSTPVPAESPAGANLPPELASNPQYEVLGELGRGGMGVVYLARNKILDRLEVLKVVNKALLDCPGAVERFLREIRSAARLSHANVVAAYSAVQSGELLAFAMEYVEGEDLAKLVQAQGPLPVAHACSYVQQAAQGLQHAFEKQMVHRDIKPQNLILAREGNRHIVKILDFGLAKVTRARNKDTGLTDDGAMLGTPDYVAPEQTLDAANADIRADVYSLGCTLYYLLTGAPPFKGRSLFDVLQAHQSLEARPLNLVRAEVPQELAAVVRKMMAKDPAQRYQTPAEVAVALAAFVEQGAEGRDETRQKTPPSSLIPHPSTLSPVAGDTVTESSRKTIGPRPGQTVGEGRPPVGKPSGRKWLIGGGIAAGLLLIGLVGLWAGGVIRLKTPEGTLVVDVNVPNPEVYVDGRKMTISWDEGGQQAEIRVPAGTREVKVTKDGFTAYGEQVELSEGKHRVLKAWLEPVQRVKPGPGGRPKAGEGRRAGKERDDNALKLKLCWCPAGSFRMGSPAGEVDRVHNEGPVDVTLSRGFWMGKTEVTQSQWEKVMGTGLRDQKRKAGIGEIRGEGPDHPMYFVTYTEATEFCRKLTASERAAGRLPAGWDYRLPTEAQWEYACRAGTTTATAFGDRLGSDQANVAWDRPYNGASPGPNHRGTVPVGSFRPNAWGIVDMHGNVWEWCRDWYADSLAGGRDPEGLPSGPLRSKRGGAWCNVGAASRSAGRAALNPEVRYDFLGFRVARVPSE
jgi:serine/threonine protein kinase/formylglycine-generating enzyme required for sulfatase activity